MRCCEPEELVGLVVEFVFELQVLDLQRSARLVPVHCVLALGVDRYVGYASDSRRSDDVRSEDEQLSGAQRELLFELDVRFPELKHLRREAGALLFLELQRFPYLGVFRQQGGRRLLPVQRILRHLFDCSRGLGRFHIVRWQALGLYEQSASADEAKIQHRFGKY